MDSEKSSVIHKKCKQRILVVEDDEGIGKLIQSILETEGDYEVLACHTLIHAMSEIEKFSPQLVVMDIGLKGEVVDGIDFYRMLKTILKKNSEDLPMIIVSAMTGAELRKRALEAGAKDYLMKPFDPEDLLSSLNKILKHG